MKLYKVISIYKYITMNFLLDIMFQDDTQTSRKKFTNKLKDIFPDNFYYMQMSNKEDSFFEVLCMLNEPEFINFSTTKKQQEIINTKTKLLMDFDTLNLYHTFKYVPEMGAMTDIQKMIHKNDIKPILLQFCADYYKWNLFIIDKDSVTAYYTENVLMRDKRNVFMVYENKSYCSLSNGDLKFNDVIFQKLLAYNMVLPNLKYPEKHTLTIEESKEVKLIKKMKLPELQALAAKYQLGIKKNGKSGVINKTKTELINELSHKKIEI